MATLLDLRFEGADGSQVFTDSSSYNRAVTVSSGTPIISTTNPLSGSSSLLLGTDGEISIPHFTTPTNSAYFRTIEFRIQTALTDIANNEAQGVFTKGVDVVLGSWSHDCILVRNATGNGGTLYLWLNIPATPQPSSYVSVDIPDISVNNHVAFTQRNNGTYAAYLNGILVFTSGFTQSYQDTNMALRLGTITYYWGGSYTSKFKGRLDNFRISNIDRYPTNFTPPV